MENEFQGLESRQEAILNLQSWGAGQQWEDGNRMDDSDSEEKCKR